MKKAIIVGATSGIGKCLAELLAKDDFRVGITGRRSTVLDQMKNEKPECYVTKTFDITQTAFIAEHLEDLTRELGGLDLLIISSGTGDLNDGIDFEIEKRTIDTNVSGFTAIADWAFNYFSSQNHGHLVAISSIAGLFGNHQAPGYAASKAYQINYLQGLRIKAYKSSLPVNITDIRPGFVDTSMAKGEKFFWMTSPEKASFQILKAILNKRKVVYITKRWVIIAFLFKFLPTSLLEKL